MYREFFDSRIEKGKAKKRNNEEALAAIDDSQMSMAASLDNSQKRSKTRRGQSAIDTSAQSKLTMAIADFVHSKGLPFSITEGPHFKQILSLARNTTSSYIPPDCKRISGELLTLNYNHQMEEFVKRLQDDAESAGISMYST